MTGGPAIDLPNTERFTAPDGRSIGFCSYGDRQAPPVIVLHGTPGSRFLGLHVREAAERSGVRLVFPDRPGYGVTDPVDHETRARRLRGHRPTRRERVLARFHDADDDVIALLDHLGVERAPLVAISGGGGFAVSVAAAHPERIERLVLACAAMPGAPASVLARRLPIVALVNRVARWAPWVAVAMLGGTGPFKNTKDRVGDSWPAADRAVMEDPRAMAIAKLDAAEATRQDPAVAVHELADYQRSAPFRFSDVAVPTVFLHGDADGNVPIEVARWAQGQIRGSRLVVLPDAGHQFLAADPEPLFDALVAPLR